MRRFMTEQELESADIRGYHEISVASDTANYLGTLVKEDRRLAPLTTADKPGTQREVNQLFIVVQDPENSDAIERVKARVIKKLAE